MPPDKQISDFPDVEAKLQKPSKQSAFEKQRAEAEAKRRREAAETAAVYEDFVKSFDHDDDDAQDTGRGLGDRQGLGAQRGRPGFGGAPAAASRRHFGSSGLKSGPGTLGPVNAPSAPSSFGKKRSFQDFARGPRDRGVLGFEDHGAGQGHSSVPKAFEASDDEDDREAKDRAEEKARARPTLRLSNLPPGTSPAVIKALIPTNLTVENVKIAPSTGQAGSERKHASAVVTLSQETPANEIDGAVSSLQNRYLGYGHYLSLHRHLSSAVIGSAALPTFGSSSVGSHPFGAKPVEQPSTSNQNHTQQQFQRGFAPPSTYNNPHSGLNRANLFHVPVKPPGDIRIIQSISKVIEGVLEHGPEFEALLMSRAEVQREEKWAWIWDARSEGGIWYRWRLWEVVTGAQQARVKGKYVPLFDGSHAWKTPDKQLPYEYTTALEEFVSDDEYNSSDDEEMDAEVVGQTQGEDAEKTFLNPLEKAKLTHLLARLPTSLTRLRKGDIARVTAFAITHASRGVDEVVDILVSNVAKPLSSTMANLEKREPSKEGQTGPITEEAAAEARDTSAASLIALYAINDILSSSSTSGVRHAWRYRQLFETALRDHKTFETLGILPDKLKWGRFRAEKWKRSISLILNLWEGWCVFTAEAQELFVKTFEEPPSLKVEEKVTDVQGKGRWKTLDAASGDSAGDKPALPASAKAVEEDDVPGEAIDEDDIKGEPVAEDDVEGEPMEEDDVEGEPIVEDDVEGEPIAEEDIDGEPMDEDEAQGADDAKGVVEERAEGRIQQRKRPRAVDMFADGDESDG